MTEIIFVVEEAPEGGTWRALSGSRSLPKRNSFPSCTNVCGMPCSAISTPDWDRS